jgi:hypothetical protein
MKKTDKIAGVVSIFVIIFTIIYLLKTKLIANADDRILYAVGALFIFSLGVLIVSSFATCYILRKRIYGFSKIAKEYTLQHSHVNNWFFIPYGKLNMIKGNISGHVIEIYDDSFLPNTGELAGVIFYQNILPFYVNKKSLNMNTKIYIDGKNVTPNYPQKWVLYRDPFMGIKEIKKYISKI